jgi:hypothetical protein
MTTAELVKSVSIENLLNQRAGVLERVEKAVSLLREAAALAGAAHLGFPRISVANGWGGYDRAVVGEYANPADTLAVFHASIDGTGWRYLMDESGLRSLMCASKRAEFDREVSEGTFPALTVEAIRATFEGLHSSRADMFEQGVIECFRRLSWRYKTNQPQKFGKRIVVSYLGGYSRGAADHLDDLLRVFHVMDGKPEADHRAGVRAMLSQSTRASHGWPKLASNDYIAVKVFKNDNGHVTFKRLDLVDRLNEIIAKHYPGALPAPKH